MSYNKNYNTRNSSARFNTPGKFVPAEAPKQIPSFSTGQGSNFPKQETQPPQQPQNNYHTYPQEQLYDSNNDVLMKTETDQTGEETPAKPHWMKDKLAGVKKISNRERRRRQNKHLRKLLSPKNALMTLNEMMPREQVLNNMKIEEVSPQFYGGLPKNSFVAEIILEGNTYKGFGESKNAAKNTAAEQAIRDLLIKRLGTVAQPASTATGTTESIAESDEDEPEFPMMQLASFALHKLFNDWQAGGLPVPSLRPANPNAAAKPALPPPPKPPKVPHVVPLNAGALHPCSLLGYLRPGLQYRDLGVDGVNPPNLTYTAGVDVDGITYIGKGGSKKEARRLAAKATCETLYSIQFDPTPTEIVPKAPPAQ